MPEFTDNLALGDREALLTFPNFVRDVFSRVLETWPLVPELRDPAFAAWRDPLVEGALDEMGGRLRNLPDEILAAHGLLGIQLAAKRRALRFYYDASFRSPEPAAPRRRFGLGWVRQKLLELIRSVLASVLEALGYGSLLREVADLIAGVVTEEAGE